MDPKERAIFIAAYSRLVAEVWSDPAKERMLAESPRELLALYGLAVPDEVDIQVVREVENVEPALDVQVQMWGRAVETGQLVLVVPSIDLASDEELAEHELDNVVAGLDSSCACCCPCCCTT